MSADGTPELYTKRLGAEIARLRTNRQWSRTTLINHLYDELIAKNISRDGIGEAWLSRLEAGRIVKVPRDIVEALCHALRCSSAERVRVLLLADRNVLANAEAAAVAEVLNYVMDRLYQDTSQILNGMIGQRGVDKLNEQEKFELVATALELVIHKQREKQASC